LQHAMAVLRLERHHPRVVYTPGTPAPVHKVNKRVRVVLALAPPGQARSLVMVVPQDHVCSQATVEPQGPGTDI
ncbi:hypothetical protein Tco_0832753, partial [Tanacetum coccineum]